MPRIDPLKLLTCLSVLLAENGGIRSTQEVKRLAGLMAKFSKKLVSKCIYIHILKCTKTELLGQFMAAGGWTLTHQWLADGMNKLNWPLVQEILELLLLCPVDVPRLKSNSSPKLVKSLSKDNSNEGVRILATKLVEQWLKIVKFETSSVEMMPEPAKLENIPMNSDSQSVSGNPIINSSTLTVGQTTITKVPTKKVDESRSNNINFLDCNIAEDNDNNYAIDESLFRSPESESQCINNRNDLAITLNEKSSCKMLNNTNKPTETLVFKITVKDGKQVLAKVESSSPKKTSTASAGKKLEENDKEVNKDSIKDLEKVKSSSSNDKDRDSSKSKERDKEKDKQRDKDRDRKPVSSSSHRSSSSSNKSSSKSHSHKSNSSSSGSKSSSKDRHRSSSSKTSSSSSSNKDKDRDKNKDKQTQAEKDKDTLAKVMAPTLDKLGKIPKKSKDESGTSSSSTSSKKPSISIEVRKDVENRPKTVKTFNSQFRSHGLAEEAPPPPSRKGLKKPSSGIATSPIPNIAPPPISSLTKRSLSPPPSKEVPPEKKIRTESNSEKPGSIKLIPAKPKPTLVESDMFMDALSASVTTSKKDLKKRKRRTSTSKDTSGNGSPPGSPSTPTSPTKVMSAPLKFYQDTLDDNNVSDEQKSKVKNDDSKDDVSNDSKDPDDSSSKAKKLKRENSDDVSDENCDTTGDDNIKNENSPEDEEATVNEKKVPGPGCGVDGPPGVLMLHRRKGPKKQLKWRPVEQLEEIRYFELDENERVNVTKTFTDMKQMERYNEREAFLMARKLSSEDTMVEQTPWAALIEFDSLPVVPDGNQSKEKEIQAERERTVLKALYFNKQMIPDSPSEPDIELFQVLEPQVIPLDDIAGNSNSVNDFTTMPWPDPKNSPNHSPTNLGHCISVESPYSGVDVYPNKLQWYQSEIPQFPDGQFPIGIPGPEIPPGVPPFGLPPLNFGGGGNFNNFQQNPPPSNRHRSGQGNQGGGWYRPNGPPPSWNNNNNNRQSGNMQSGGGPQRPWVYGNGRGICKQFQNKGFCRQGDKCNYLHITGNGSNF